MFAMFVLAACGCQTIEPGYGGVLVNKFGENRGVQDYPVKTGLVFYNPVSETVYEYPCFKERFSWSAGIEGNPDVDESITVNDSKGVRINMDIAAMVGVQCDKIPHVFVEYRKEATILFDGYVRDRVRSHLNDVASTMNVVEIFGEGKMKMFDEAERRIREELSGKGFDFDSLALTSRLRVDKQIEASINAVLEQQQASMRAEAKVQEVKALAEQARAEAEGKANAVKEEANGAAYAQTTRAAAEAESLLAIATAQARANKMIAESLTAELLKLRSTERWNGTVPTVQLGQNSLPILNLGNVAQ